MSCSVNGFLNFVKKRRTCDNNLYNLEVCHDDTERKITMNDDIKKVTAITTILFIATSLLLVILMMRYNYTFVKVLTGVHMLAFLLSGIGLVKLKTENDE